MAMIRREAAWPAWIRVVGILTAVLLSGHIPALAGQLTAGEPKPVAIDPRIIHDLIKQLGDDSFEAREEAHKRLATIGGDALELLREAAVQSTDAEVRGRAGQLARAIQTTLLTEVRRCEKHIPGVFPWATRVVVSSDGRHAVSAGCDGLRSWDLTTGKQIRYFGEIKQGGY